MFHTIGSIIGHYSYLCNNSFSNTEMAVLIFDVERESGYWLDLPAEVRELIGPRVVVALFMAKLGAGRYHVSVAGKKWLVEIEEIVREQVEIERQGSP